MSKTAAKKVNMIAQHTGHSTALVDALLHSMNSVLDKHAMHQGRPVDKHRMDAIALLDILKSCPDIALDYSKQF